MPEQIQAIINRILDWWKKFTRRQQLLIVSITAVVVVAFIILAYIISRPTMVQLIACEDGTQAASVKSLLEDNSIGYDTSRDGYTFYINEKDMANANIILGSNEIRTSGYSINDVIDGSFSTTEADKEKRYKLYLEERFGEYLESLTMVDKAKVTLTMPKDDGTIMAQQQDAYAAIELTLNSSMSAEVARTIAKFVATQVGNDDTENIVIMDSNGNMLYSGSDETNLSAAGQATANQDVRERVREDIAREVKDVISQTKYYDNVEVGLSLNMNFDEHSYVDYDYSIDEGRTEGYLDYETGESTSSTGGSGGVPGTDSNDDDTTYVTDDGTSTESSSEKFTKDYLPDERITTHKDEVGKINYEDSSISVACITYAIYNQDEMEKNGQLTNLGMTFDEFVAANSERVAKDVPEGFTELVAKATGFPTSNVTIMAYEVPMFQYSEGPGIDITQILQIVLAALIFLMLGFVVFRSLKVEEEEPVEEELSIDELIASTREEDELEDIGYTEKSEARILIEKFVDEKPEAVAQLLRNWLNEDWG